MRSIRPSWPRKISKQLLHEAVVMYQSNRRQGTVKTKGRSDVAGTTKKMYRQKGTGNARAGSRRSGIRRGGGHIHAISPRDWSYHLPKKAVRLATRMAVASRLADDQVTLLNELAMDQPKTKEIAAILKALKLEGQSVLVAVAGYDANVYKSIRNLADVSVLPVSDLNALAVLRPRRVLMTTAALDTFRKTHGRRRGSDLRSGSARAMANEKTSLQLEPHQVILRPLVTEKGMHKASRINAYAFEVNPLANKDDIRRAVETLFDVRVVAVNTQNRHGKPRRTRYRSGYTKNWKKAIVTLDPEHRINFF